jgi:hypothetical protein
MSTITTPFGQAIDSLATSMRLIASLPLASPALALTNIQQMLDNLKAHPPTHNIYLDTLEQLRHPLLAVIQDQAPHYHDKPLPLARHGETVFRQSVAILREMCHAYQHCAQYIEDMPHAEDAPEYRRLLTLTLHRSLHYASAFVYEHFHARQELPSGIWLEIHKYYAEAELRGVAQKQVMDTLLHEENASSCATLYIALLLVEIADPYTYDARDQNLIRHWAMFWAPFVSIDPLESGQEIPPFIVDLSQDKAMHPASDSVAGGSARYLDTFGLTARLGEARAKLSYSPDPALVAALNLGDTHLDHVCKLLNKLSAPWGLTVSPRRFHRHAAHGQLKLCCGFEHIHGAISGEVFKQPEIFAFPQHSDPDPDDLGLGFAVIDPNAASMKYHKHQVVSFPTSTWDILDYSVNGFRLARPVLGLQVAHRQLLALCPYNSQHYLLGEACWLMQDSHEDCLHLGVFTLPGIPQAVAVRPNDAPNAEPYVPAFLLPGLERTGTPPALVLPIGMYRPQRVISLAQAGSVLRVVLGRRWKYGLDFEVVSYT